MHVTGQEISFELTSILKPNTVYIYIHVSQASLLMALHKKCKG